GAGRAFRNDGVIDQVANNHADGPADGAQEDAVSGQAGKACQGLVADGIDADDEIANQAADEDAADDHLQELLIPGSALVPEDAEEQPAEQAADGAVDGVVIDAR